MSVGNPYLKATSLQLMKIGQLASVAVLTILRAVIFLDLLAMLT